MKQADTMFAVLSAALVGGALWMLARRQGFAPIGAAAASSAPPSSMLYHAKNNPNGYVFVPSGNAGGGAWTKVSPEGVAEYWADVF